MRRGRWYIGLAALAAAAWSCSGGASAPAASKSGESAQAPASGARSSAAQDRTVQGQAAQGLGSAVIGDVTLDEQMLAHVVVEPVVSGSLPTLLTAPGKIQFNEDAMGRVIPPVAGQVQGLAAKVGDHVQKGQVLFYIYSRDVAASISEHLDSHRDLDLAEKMYAMNKDLFEHQAASRMALEQAESDVVKARAHLARTEDTLRVLGLDSSVEMHAPSQAARIPVRAPLSGTVIERHLTEGQFVQTDNAGFLIADLSTVWVMADVYERDVHLVKVGEPAVVTADAYPDQQFRAKVSRVSDTLDPTSRTVKVRFLVSNPGQLLKPEMFASTTLTLEERGAGITVPSSAVFTEGGRTYVYLQSDARRFSRVEVETVADSATSVRVLKGLKAGDRIVRDGGVLIRREEGKVG